MGIKFGGELGKHGSRQRQSFPVEHVGMDWGKGYVAFFHRQEIRTRITFDRTTSPADPVQRFATRVARADWIFTFQPLAECCQPKTFYLGGWQIGDVDIQNSPHWQG